MTHVAEFRDFTLFVFYDTSAVDFQRDNVDVEVLLFDGSRFSATCCTVENISRLMLSHRETGENCEGLYFWASDLVVVRDISPQTLIRLARSLVETGDLSTVFRRLDDSVQLEQPDG
jgi:hypothetical protein